MPLIRSLSLTVSILILVGCNFFKSPEERFWIWFSENAHEIGLVESANKRGIVDELSRQLEKIHSDLTFETGGSPGGIREFIISANGLAEAVPFVKRLVDRAPEIQGWEIIAFRPRRGTEFTLQFDEVELRPEDFWFTASQDGERIGLEIYLPKIDSEHKNSIIGASFIMIDTALGEYDVITKIGYIDHKPLPLEPEENGLLPLSLLAQTVDSYFKEQF